MTPFSGRRILTALRAFDSDMLSTRSDRQGRQGTEDFQGYTPFFIRLWEIFRVLPFGTCYTFQPTGQATYCQNRFSADPAIPELFALILIHKRM